MAILQVLKGSNPGQQFPLDTERIVIGRHPECDIVIDMGSVSREHAQILRQGTAFVVEDLHSRNGTFVNGQLIQGRRQLKDNDRLKICDLLFTFHQSQPGATQPEGDFELSTQLTPVVVDDDESGSSTIMSQLDVGSDPSGLHMTVKPEAKLRALIEITENLGKTLSLDKVLPGILDSLFKIFIQADRGFVVLRGAVDGHFITREKKLRHGNVDEAPRISRTIVRKAMDDRQAILSADAASDERFDLSQSIADFKIRSMMCAPLINSEGKALGVIQIDTQNQRSRFRQEDLDVLVAIARQAALAMENAQLHEGALQQRALERDLELAHKVQQGFLPASFPRLPGYAFFDYYEPARRLGGDYYDYVDLPDGRLAVVVADVSGKGISASLLTARLSADIRYCLASEPEPARAIRRLNDAFVESRWEDRFVTLVLTVIDRSNHSLTVVNAGHMPPLLRRRDGTIEPVGSEITGFPLGVSAGFAYEQARVSLAPEDWVVLYTDGISEAMDAEDNLYGTDRLQSGLAERPQSVTDLGHRILDSVRRFVAGHPQSDDMCLLCFGRIDSSGDDLVPWSWTRQHRFPSETGAGKKILEELLAQLEVHDWPQSDIFGIHLAVEEALVNAIKHGNALDVAKQVEVDCKLSPDQFWISITDEGPGFNPDAVPDPTRPENLDAPGGRGLMLMENFMTEVRFNERGNQVTMQKQRSEDQANEAGR